MSQSSKEDATLGRRYALCVGIGTYTKLTNRNLRYAVVDAKAVAERLGDPQRGNFAVTLLTEPAQTTERVLDGALDKVLNAPGLNAEDLVVIYLACHGDVYGKGNTFYFQPSDADVEVDGRPKKPTVIDIYGLAKALSEARVKNIIFLLDVCHSGGAGVVLEHLDLKLNPDTNLFIIGSARHDQTAVESSRLGHGIFTSCLLQAFEQEPNRPDGWLTILDIYSFVSKVIKSEASKLSGQESPVQIQARSASVNPNLLFVKNPHYSPQNCEFHNEVKKLLELVQYEPVETVIPEVAPAGFYIAEIKSGLRIHRVGIIPYYNKIESLASEDAEKIALFVKEQIEKEDLDEGLLVTALEVGKEVKNTIRNSGVRYLDIRTYGSVWKNLIDFKKYLQKLVDEYQTSAPERRDDPPLAEVYIYLDAERRQYKVDASLVDVVELKSTGEPRKDYELTWQGDLEEEVICWLSDADPASSRLAVLADYGSGKSTFCEHLAARLAKDNLNTKGHERYGYRIPLLIPLRNFGKNPVDLEGYLVAYLKQYCRVDNPNFEALMKMAEAGLLLFILDGFDEMASRATTDTVRLNIELFESLANLPQNKVLLTTRPEYFMNMNQEKQVLQAYPCLYLQPFKKEQI
ncbi:MAG TPA: NACHT domain-containing protein, partial [Ktedonobacteraceae bacterium]|nr:NACHT domain-containing protein [Ktedonobacteraceae bacterium]